MSEQIDYFLTSASPFTYLGHKKFLEIASANKKSIQFRPFDIFGVWEISGAVPPGQRPLVRQRYREIDLMRVAGYRGVNLNVRPKFFPTDPTLADHCIIALDQSGENPAAFSETVGSAVWNRDLQIADEETLSSLLEECGHDASEILKLAQTDGIKAIRTENTQMAVECDAVGAPAYYYNGEVFWGQDRLEYLEHMIVSGRGSFDSDL